MSTYSSSDVIVWPGYLFEDSLYFKMLWQVVTNTLKANKKNSPLINKKDKKDVIPKNQIEFYNLKIQ